MMRQRAIDARSSRVVVPCSGERENVSRPLAAGFVKERALMSRMGLMCLMSLSCDSYESY